MDIIFALLQYSSSTLRSSCLTAGVVCEQQNKLIFGNSSLGWDSVLRNLRGGPLATSLM